MLWRPQLERRWYKRRRQVVISKALLAEIHILVHVVLAGYQCVARTA